MAIKSILDWEIQSYANRKNIWNSEKYSFGKINFFMGIWVNSSIFDSIVLSKLSVDFEKWIHLTLKSVQSQIKEVKMTLT